MPYDTPYNRMIANERNNSNQTYADINAYSNQLYNGRGRFDEARIRFPDRDGTGIEPRMLDIAPSNYEGGVTHRNLEGSGGALGRTFNHLGMGEDARRIGRSSRLFYVPPFENKNSNSEFLKKEFSDNESSDSEDEEGVGTENEIMRDAKLKGDGFFDDVWSGVKNVASKISPSDIIKYGKEGYDLYKDYKKGKGVSGGRKTSSWIEHVKAFAKSHKIKYRDALKQAKSTYKGKGISGGNVTLDIKPFASPMTQAVMNNNAMTSGPIGRGVSGGASTEFPKKYMKSTGHHWEGATLGAGVSGGSVIGGPSNDPVNRGRISGGRKKKTGSALFAPEGEFSLEAKTSDVSPILDTNAVEPKKNTKGAGRKSKGKGFISDNPIIKPQNILAERVAVKKGKGKVGANPATWTPQKKLGTKSSTYTPQKKLGTNPATYAPLVASGKKRGRPCKVGSSKRKADEDAPKTKEEEAKVIFTKEAPKGLVKPVPKKPQGQGHKKGGMLKELMRGSTISGGAKMKVGCVEPVNYPSTKNITGFGKIPKMVEIIKEVMAKKGCKMAEAKRLIKEAKKGKGISGGHWYNDLWSGIKEGAKFVAPLVPFIA